MKGTLIYALGGGLGHLTRACALARAALPARVRILTNSPFADCVREALPEIDIVALPSDLDASSTRNAVNCAIEKASPECLIVDTFPRGLLGELAGFVPLFQGLKVLVQRDLNPQYSAAFQLNLFRDSYDLVIVPGDSNVVPSPHAAVTAPWLVRSYHELPDRARAIELLNVDSTKPCALVCAAGNPDELLWYGAVTALLIETGRCQVRCVAPVCPEDCPRECWIRYWPAMDLYSAADVVIGGAGYNTIYECLACGVPLIARPWPRKYDRQRLRAEHATAFVDTPEQAASAALTALGSAARNKQFPNGATEAVKLIEQLERTRQ